MNKGGMGGGGMGMKGGCVILNLLITVISNDSIWLDFAHLFLKPYIFLTIV